MKIICLTDQRLVLITVDCFNFVCLKTVELLLTIFKSSLLINVISLMSVKILSICILLVGLVMVLIPPVLIVGVKFAFKLVLQFFCFRVCFFNKNQVRYFRGNRGFRDSYLPLSKSTCSFPTLEIHRCKILIQGY